MFKKLDNPTKFLIWMLVYIFGFSSILAYCVSYLEWNENIVGVIAILTTVIFVSLLLKRYIKIPK